jgi:hypothetical protein
MANSKGASQPPKPADVPGALEGMNEMASKLKLTPFEDFLQQGGGALILKALENGYSYTDISRKLREYGIPVSLKTLSEKVELLRSEDSEDSEFSIRIEMPEAPVAKSPKPTQAQSSETTRANGHH